MTVGTDMDVNRLLYRRQYIMGPRPFNRPGWNVVRVADDLWLSAHPDLGIVQTERNGVRLVLLGYILDPYAPDASDQQVLDRVAEGSQSFDEVILHTNACSGRWVIIYTDGSSVKAFNDTIGSRQVYYTMKNGEFWCSAQPALLAEQLELNLDSDPLLQEYVNSTVYQQNQRFWPGNGCVYEGVLHLLPNHYLDVRTGAVVRFWPNEAMGKLSPKEAVPIASDILVGSLQAAAKRRPLMVTVTAGLDSRMLLAACKSIASEVYFYVLRLSPAAYALSYYNADPDVDVPAELVRKLGFDFHVIDTAEQPDEQFWGAIDASVTMARKVNAYGLSPLRHHGDRMRVIGIASEIGKGKLYMGYRGQKVTAKLLASMEHAGNAYAELRFAEWLRDADGVEENYGVSLFDLFSWEQRYANWGALGSAEADIVSEELPPFGNRKLLATLLSVDIKHRSEPSYHLHRRIIQCMWAETLSAPINPKPLSVRMRRAVKGTLRTFLGNTRIWAYIRARRAEARRSSQPSQVAHPTASEGGSADPQGKQGIPDD